MPVHVVKAFIVAITTVGIALSVAMSTSPTHASAVLDQPQYIVASPVLTQKAAESVAAEQAARFAKAKADLEAAITMNAAKAKADAAARQVRSRVSRPSVVITGDCAAMKPEGFPDYIIDRESGGNPNAVNPRSGALGCAQILPSWFQRGCSGMSYADCWAAMWNGGKGASNWACTRESGCLR